MTMSFPFLLERICFEQVQKHNPIPCTMLSIRG